MPTNMMPLCPESERQACLIEMPAGTGKTESIAKIAKIAKSDGLKILVLTHTNAGIEALQKRLRKFGVTTNGCSVWTIASFAFRLAASYQTLGQQDVGDSPDWAKTKLYYNAAKRIIKSNAISEVLRSNYDLLLVDEYQDCTQSQHEFICGLTDLLSRTIVFGDPLQGIFDFERDDKPPLWETVTRCFPPCVSAEAPLPRRWETANTHLGNWLSTDLRQTLLSGGLLDFKKVSPEILHWESFTDKQFSSQAFRALHLPGTTLILIVEKYREKSVAVRLCGKYTILEEVQGSFMIEHLKQFPGFENPEIAYWLARASKECFVGLGGIDRLIQDRLKKNAPIEEKITRAKTRQTISSILLALDNLRIRQNLDAFEEAVSAYRSNRSVSLFRYEAWNEICQAAIDSYSTNESPLEIFERRRSLAYTVRQSIQKNALSRTLLVKGLEYDNVIIENIQSFDNAKNLYVAMTRARKKLFVFGSSATIQLSTSEK